MNYDLPHPGQTQSLTRPAATLSHPMGEGLERENCSPFLVKTYDWICRTVIRKTRNAQLLFPLLGGEGQGEGGRNKQQLCIIT
jgi:hypothetical protein